MEKKNKATSVFYADDGIFLSNRPIKIRGDEKRGIEIHKEKSGYVKYDGEWRKELKFLGIRYEGITKTLTSETRKGNSLNAGSELRKVMVLLKELKPEYT